MQKFKLFLRDLTGFVFGSRSLVFCLLQDLTVVFYSCLCQRYLTDLEFSFCSGGGNEAISLKLLSSGGRGQCLAVTALLYFFGRQFSDILIAEIIPTWAFRRTSDWGSDSSPSAVLII